MRKKGKTKEGDEL